MPLDTDDVEPVTEETTLTFIVIDIGPRSAASFTSKAMKCQYLPNDVKSAGNIVTFHRQLKTHLFKLAYKHSPWHGHSSFCFGV